MPRGARLRTPFLSFFLMSLAAPTSLSIKGAAFSIGIVASRFNAEMVDVLLERVIAGLKAAGVKGKRITVVRVPGAHEVPWAAQALALRNKPDVFHEKGRPRHWTPNPTNWLG